MSIKALSITELNNIISSSEKQLPADLKAVWDDIKITPQKWTEKSHGSQTDGFWAVAVTEGEVIWYNNLAGGFNLSSFSKKGEIGEYWDDDCELQQLLWHMFT
jgi:hypothetical protein